MEVSDDVLVYSVPPACNSVLLGLGLGVRQQACMHIPQGEPYILYTTLATCDKHA